VRKLEGAFNRVTTQNKVLQLENEGLLASLDTENKRTTHGWRLPLGGKKKCATDAVFWSPRKLKEAKALQAKKDREEANEKPQRSARTDTRAANALKKKDDADRKRLEPAQAKEVKEKEKADDAARKLAEKQQKDREKALQTSQKR
jgi:hypothetical protein